MLLVVRKRHILFPERINRSIWDDIRELMASRTCRMVLNI